jgi:hypothetical protein
MLRRIHTMKLKLAKSTVLSEWDVYELFELSTAIVDEKCTIAY